MSLLLGLVGFFGFAVCLVTLVIKALRKKPKKKTVIALAIFFVLFFVGIFTPSEPVAVEATPEVVTNKIVEEKTAPVATGEPQVVAEPEQEETDTLTTGQKNALKSAKSYLSISAFSYEGLIGQLEFEQYEHDDAVFAADNCGADWNEQALKSAKNYLSISAFSYEGLIGQLEFEQFTTEQATYAADNCNADWNEQAAKSAKSYLSISSFSKDGLIDQLEYEGFTHEQAVYGVEANGY